MDSTILTSSTCVGFFTLTCDFELFHFIIFKTDNLIRKTTESPEGHLLNTINATMRLFAVTKHMNTISQSAFHCDGFVRKYKNHTRVMNTV